MSLNIDSGVNGDVLSFWGFEKGLEEEVYTSLSDEYYPRY